MDVLYNAENTSMYDDMAYAEWFALSLLKRSA